MTLTAFLTAAALTLSPGMSADRAQEIAEPIAAVANNREDGAILVVTNFAESTFRPDVETCKISGDHGKAYGAYQLHPWLWGSAWGRAWVCADPEWSARLALFALGSRGSTEGRIARFMGRSRADGEVQRRARLVRKILNAQ